MKKIFRNKVLILFIFLNIIAAAFAVYAIFIRERVIYKRTENINKVEVTDRSNVQAEWDSFELLPKNSEPRSDLRKNAYVTSFKEIDSLKDKFNEFTLVAGTIQPDLSIRLLYDTTQQRPKETVIFASLNLNDELSLNNSDLNKLTQNIASFLMNFDGLELDSSVLYKISNYNDLVTSLNNELSKTKKNLAVVVAPKWSSYLDYSPYNNYSNEYTKSLDYKTLSSEVNQFRIKGYFNITPKNILPGETMPSSWVRKVIQYFIFSGVQAEKINLIINTNSYKWEDRDIENDYIKNLNSTSDQATEVTYDDSIKLFSDRQKLNNQNFMNINADGKDYILILQDQQNIDDSINNAAEYGAFGFSILNPITASKLSL